ncbi:MAG: YciI family protein [Saprospiraceae bacterium]
MKYVALFIVWLVGTVFMSASAQTQMPIDTAGFQTFSYEEGDTTYLMKLYYMCFLKEGPKRDQPAEEAATLQTAHLAHLEALAQDRKICMVGPFDDDSAIKGIVVFSTRTYEEAVTLANADPAVRAGRLVVEVHPWWAAVGASLF